MRHTPNSALLNESQIDTYEEPLAGTGTNSRGRLEYRVEGLPIQHHEITANCNESGPLPKTRTIASRIDQTNSTANDSARERNVHSNMESLKSAQKHVKYVVAKNRNNFGSISFDPSSSEEKLGKKMIFAYADSCKDIERFPDNDACEAASVLHSISYDLRIREETTMRQKHQLPTFHNQMSTMQINKSVLRLGYEQWYGYKH